MPDTKGQIYNSTHMMQLGKTNFTEAERIVFTRGQRQGNRVSTWGKEKKFLETDSDDGTQHYEYN